MGNSLFGGSRRIDPIQLIDKFGSYKDGELKNLMEKMNLAKYGTSYKIVAIIGAQSSGKSTLLNHLFDTRFVEMISDEGRNQTTHGIWLAYNDAIKPCTLVMDIEGSDGQERGEEGTKFERQTALFALASADVVLINIWFNDIGREKASNKFLFRTVFEVMGKLYKPRKITLIFVIRDNHKYNSPEHELGEQLLKIVHEIWNSISGRSRRDDINEFFNLKFVSLPHFELQKRAFINQVSELRNIIISDTNAQHSGAPSTRDLVPAEVLVKHLQGIWEKIKENKEIDIPSHTFTLAKLECDEIRKKKLALSLQSQKWRDLEQSVESNSVNDLGNQLTNMIDECLSMYDKDTIHFEQNVKSVKRKELEDQLLQHAKGYYTTSMGHTRSTIWRQFKIDVNPNKNMDGLKNAALSTFDKTDKGAKPTQAIWNSSTIRQKLEKDMNDEIQRLVDARIPEILKEYDQKLKEALGGDVKKLLLEGGDHAWKRVRKHLDLKTKIILKDYRAALSPLSLSESWVNNCVRCLEDYGIDLVKETAKLESDNILSHMERRFMDKVFESRDLKDIKRQEDFDEKAHGARTECLKLLSTLAVIRLGDCSDSVANPSDISNLIASPNALELSYNYSWGEVNDEHILLKPRQCVEIWKAFGEKTTYRIREKFSWGKFGRILLNVVKTVAKLLLF